MKLNLKDLKQQKFQVDAEPTDTVAQVKERWRKHKRLNQVLSDSFGKILADTNAISSYDIKPNDSIVCMISKPKNAPVSQKATTPSTPASAQQPRTPAAPAPAAATSSTASTTQNAPATPSPAPAQTATTTGASLGTTQSTATGSSPLMMGAERESAIANMEGMGFARAEIEPAMRAAFYNQERAIEYLLNGIPESARQAVPPPAQATNPTSPQGATTLPSAASLSPAVTGTTPAAEGEEPVNLFEAAAARGTTTTSRGGAGGVTSQSTPSTQQGVPGATGRGSGGVDAAMGAAAATAASQGNLDFLRDNATFQHLRQLVQQQPSMLENVLQQVGASNPQLAHLISNNPEQFLQLLSEGEEGEQVPMPPGAQNISVTEEERDAIERLCRLGFERDLVIQAYFACDKNEELAANFLFENLEDDGGAGGAGF